MSDLKKVDYECLTGSQVLMEFSQHYQAYKQTGFLIEPDGAGFNASGCAGVWYDNCQIYQNPGYWISAMCLFSHSLPSGLRVKIILNDGRGCEGRTIGNIGRVISDHGTTYNIGQINCIHVLGAAEGYEL